MQVAWIPGNRDADSPSDFDHLFNSALAGRNRHGRVITVAGTRIAGLGGVFREKVWMPPAEPIYGSAAELLRDTKRTARGRGGLPLKHRSTILHNDYLHLARLQADVLVSHEAPGAHPQGNEAIEMLGVAMGVARIFYGHTHDSINYTRTNTTTGVEMHGVGLSGITTLSGTRIIPRELDEARSNRKEWT